MPLFNIRDLCTVEVTYDALLAGIHMQWVTAMGIYTNTGKQ